MWSIIFLFYVCAQGICSVFIINHPPFYPSIKSHGKKSEGDSSHEFFTVGSVGSQKGFRMMEGYIITTKNPTHNMSCHLQKINWITLQWEIWKKFSNSPRTRFLKNQKTLLRKCSAGISKTLQENVMELYLTWQSIDIAY